MNKSPNSSRCGVGRLTAPCFAKKKLYPWEDSEEKAPTTMDKKTAVEQGNRKILEVKTCPFCGVTPEFKFYCDEKHSKYGSFGHYAHRNACCRATGLGQTELFFCNDHESPDYELWFYMICRLVEDWNHRTPDNTNSTQNQNQ